MIDTHIHLLDNSPNACIKGRFIVESFVRDSLSFLQIPPDFIGSRAKI